MPIVDRLDYDLINSRWLNGNKQALCFFFVRHTSAVLSDKINFYQFVWTIMKPKQHLSTKLHVVRVIFTQHFRCETCFWPNGDCSKEPSKLWDTRYRSLKWRYKNTQSGMSSRANKLGRRSVMSTRVLHSINTPVAHKFGLVDIRQCEVRYTKLKERRAVKAIKKNNLFSQSDWCCDLCVIRAKWFWRWFCWRCFHWFIY